MTESEPLASLTIKDLRQLAGEHQIQNRSRLGREELIQALQSAIDIRGAEQRPSQSAIDFSPALAASAAAAGGESVVVPASVAAPIAVPAVVPEPVPAIAQEPEVLDAAVVAAVTGEPSDVADEGDDGAGDEPGQSGDLNQTGDPSRRRRRRRRGRGRGRGGDGQDFSNDQGDGQGQPEPLAPQQAAPTATDAVDVAAAAITEVQPAAEAPIPAAESHRDERGPRDGRRDDRGPREGRRDDRGPRNDGRRDDRGPRDQQRPQEQGNRQSRPRLDGQLRHLPSVLDRLCAFSKGLVELCDPQTPSWAQPRIAELLAEAGVSPTPCTGVPHPDFHLVIGTLAGAQVPPGHIAEVAAPGFSLRGDRGDLFPLKKAQVRIAEGGRQGPLPSEPPPVAIATPPPVAVVAPAPAPIPVMVAPPADAGNEGASEPEGDTAAEVSAQVERPQPPPAQGRDPRRPHGREPAGVAPALPLASQVPEELAQRPKAEGFRALGLNDQILADLAAMGWKEPSPIQTEAIPHVLARRDVLGQAQTGTGKTGAFALPLLQRLYSLEREQGSAPAVLVLAPTRELARQVHGEFVRMAGASGARCALIYGGVPMDEQFRALERGPHVVVGTPGRIIDHMKRRSLDLSRLEAIILDEADQMLDIGFWPDIQYVMSHTPPTRQVLLFSATFPQPILDLITRHMKDPVHVRIAPKQVTVEQVDQAYIAVARERKNELLRKFIETQDPPQLLVFCKTKHQTDRVAEVLKRKNMSAEAIHGDLPQSRRERALQQFRDGELRCLIATNVAARGLDIPTVSHVVNYDIPETPEEYVHRIGRTARNGAKGIARTFITSEDGQFLLEIEKHIGLLLEEEVVEGFSEDPAAKEGPKRILAETEVGSTRLLKPLTGKFKLGRRR